ncbi:MAG: hypothetical protein R2788_24830 [Saprospiraceae bacterium]
MEKKKDYPSDFNNHLFQLSNKVVFTGEKGIYYYDRELDRFAPDDSFQWRFTANNLGKIFGKMPKETFGMLWKMK